MKLAELQKAGGFVDDAPVKKSVEWTDPAGNLLKFDVFVYRQPFGALERLYSADGDRSKSAELISTSIGLGDDGKERLTYEQAYKLDPSLAGVLIQSLNEVNSTKNSPPPTNSGTN